MILKPALGHSHDIVELERIAKDHPSCATKARKQIENIRKGDQGEASAAHFLDRAFRDSSKVALLHDIRIECAEADFAQIDHLLIHRFQGTAWILETKNYTGDLSCDEHGDWTVYNNKKRFSIPSPIEQARRQVVAFERWLKKRSISGIRRLVPVVLVNPRSSINRKHLRDSDNVIKSDNFDRWFDEQAQSISFGKALSMFATSIDEAKLREIGDRICKENCPVNFDWESRMGVGGIVPAPSESSTAAPARKAEIVPPQSAAIAAEDLNVTVSEQIVTPHGDITIRNIGTDYAVRSPPHPDVIEAMRKACKGKGRWNPRYKNWLIAPEHIEDVKSELKDSFS